MRSSPVSFLKRLDILRYSLPDKWDKTFLVPPLERPVGDSRWLWRRFSSENPGLWRQASQ
jgi:hypothetical protein